MRYARVSFWIQARPCSLFHTRGRVPQLSHAFLRDRPGGFTPGHKFASTRIILASPTSNGNDSTYALRFLRFTIWTGRASVVHRTIDHESLGGDLVHVCDSITRHDGKSTMVLSRLIRGSIRTTGLSFTANVRRRRILDA